MKLSSEMSSKHFLCEALFELKSLQDFLTDSSTKYFGKLLAKLVGVDTIPFILLTKDGLLSHEGVEINHENGNEESFTSNYFRIESIDKKESLATVSLLRPLDIQGDPPHSHHDVIRLKKTSNFIEVDLLTIYAIQTVDIELLKRKIIIEPKW
ncbi:Spore coat protein Y [Neobacillus rhizosphaerae]|uniref:Spore coat protein Y n=1 Tax=Neobacillus rhizosphaerae TaxID=2880965 RepID=A0ABM9EPP6_9BACI|nr:CotY/CotZ family spore coat protein [Neobacillus rhizosphaerae]CAH2714586.1 Spore coat protein Y [Neobacillus rhizosphaerae]